MWTEAIPGWSISWFSGHGPRCGRKRSQDGRFHDFLGMAPDVDGSDPRMVDFMTFWLWLQMSTKPIPSQPTQAANPAPNIGFDIGSNTESNVESSIGSNIKSYIESIKYWIQWWIQYWIQYWKTLLEGLCARFHKQENYDWWFVSSSFFAF